LERYRIHNHFDALDSPGEWYLDRKTGTLYYWPLPGEDMETAEIIAPRLTGLLLFKGNPEGGQFVRHLRFIGLAFQHEDWNFDRQSEIDGQAHAGQQNATITAIGLRDSSFERCEIAHAGSHAIRLDAGCQDNRIVQCHIHDCGGGAKAKVVENVPFASDQFATCTWFGISSLDNDRTAYYLDNMEMTIDDTVVRYQK
jgi:hypothetical protein